MFTALAEGFGQMNNHLNLFIALAPLTYQGEPTHPPTDHE